MSKLTLTSGFNPNPAMPFSAFKEWAPDVRFVNNHLMHNGKQCEVTEHTTPLLQIVRSYCEPQVGRVGGQFDAAAEKYEIQVAVPAWVREGSLSPNAQMNSAIYGAFRESFHHAASEMSPGNFEIWKSLRNFESTGKRARKTEAVNTIGGDIKAYIDMSGSTDKKVARPLEVFSPSGPIPVYSFKAYVFDKVTSDKATTRCYNGEMYTAEDGSTFWGIPCYEANGTPLNPGTLQDGDIVTLDVSYRPYDVGGNIGISCAFTKIVRHMKFDDVRPGTVSIDTSML